MRTADDCKFIAARVIREWVTERTPILPLLVEAAAPSWSAALATAGTVLAIVAFWVAATIVATNVALWAQVHVR